MTDNLIWVEIKRQALLDNICEIKKILHPGVKIMAIIKSEAYGHGLSEVAKVVGDDVDWFGVNKLEEAKKLKSLGFGKPILILGYTPCTDLTEVVENDFRQVVYNRQVIEELGKCLEKFENKTAKVHLKLETGTNRQGIDEGTLLSFLSLIKNFPKIEVEGVYTHFADTEDSDNLYFAREQLANFKRMIATLTNNGLRVPFMHCACTAAILLLKDSHFNLVRLGAGIYGFWPSEKTKKSTQKLGLKVDLKPALTWKTRIAQIKTVKIGESVGYGLTFKTKRDSQIAVLPVGYFDGYDRKLSNRGEVLIGGRRAAVVGRVCMNMIMVDVTDIPNVKVEDEVVLLGCQGDEEITADELASKLGTINYEVVSRINPQIPRMIV